jgi:prepilin-type N-terminal cleavage/methylation domain-containing protein
MAYLKKRQHGFTLQEMVIVVAIVAIISTSVYLMFINGRKLFSLQNYSAIAQDQALKASLVMQRELREARAPEGMSLQAIEEANTQSIIFYADITEEAIDNRQEKVEYLLKDGQMLRGVSYWNSQTESYNPLPDLIHYVAGMAGVNVIAQYVVNGATPIFYYYDQDYTGSQNPMSYPINTGAVKIIKVHLEIDPSPDRPPEPYIQDTTIELRNSNI